MRWTPTRPASGPYSFRFGRRRNYPEIVEFVDFGFRMGAKSVYYNLMTPGQLEEGYRDQYVLDDEDACREIVYLITAAARRAEALGIAFNDRLLGWILPKYPHLVTEPAHVDVLPVAMRAGARTALDDNRQAAEDWWRERGGPPELPAVPSEGERGFRRRGGTTDDLRPFPSLADLRVDQFFCMAPFDMLNRNVENSFVRCHANLPFSEINYGTVNGRFDVWNHPLMQAARRELLDGDRRGTVCHPRCPYYRKGGRH